MKLLIIGLVSAALIAFVVIGLYSPIPYDPHNHGWYGYSEASGICLRPIPDLSGLTENTTLFLIADVPLDTAFVSRIKAIAENGGIVVLLGGKYANELLRLLGFKSSITDVTVRDYVFNAVNADFPIILVNLTTIGLNGLYHVVFIRPSIIEVKDDNAVVIGWSSFSSTSSLGKGPYPIVVAFKIGRGSIIVLPNPSPFMNSIIDKADNAEFLKALCGDKGAFLESTLRGGLLKEFHLAAYKTYLMISSTWLNRLITALPLLILTCVILLRRTRG